MIVGALKVGNVQKPIAQRDRFADGSDRFARWKMEAAIRILAEAYVEVHRLSVSVTHILEAPIVLSRKGIVERAQKLVS